MIVSSPIGQECNLSLKNVRCLYPWAKREHDAGEDARERRRRNVELPQLPKSRFCPSAEHSYM